MHVKGNADWKFYAAFKWVSNGVYSGQVESETIDFVVTKCSIKVDVPEGQYKKQRNGLINDVV